MSTAQERPAVPRLVSRKLDPPALPDGTIARTRLHAATRDARIVLVVAPAGYGKTVLARQLADADAGPVAWVSVDLLDQHPGTFWFHLVGAVRRAVPAVDDEPELLLAERGAGDPLFLTALVAQLERADTPLTLVLDGVSRITDARTLDGITTLIDHGPLQHRVVLTGRLDPALPVARWRAEGRLAQVREHDLRLTADEAVALAARGAPLRDDVAVALNERAEGWPIGLGIALAVLEGVDDPDDTARLITESDRLLGDYLASEVLGRLPPDERAAALGLSILPWFDRRMAVALLGADAEVAVAGLRRRRLFLTALDDAADALQFHDLVRRLLERELRDTDPARHRELHQRAAAIFERRGDVATTFRHLLAIGDERGASAAVIGPTLRLVDSGDRDGLVALLATMPPAASVNDPSLALDLAMSSLFAGLPDGVAAWSGRATELDRGHDPAVRRRVHSTAASLTLLTGDLEEAARQIARYRALADGTRPDGAVEQRFATTAARVALGRGRLDEADHWVTEARAIAGPATVVDVTVPALVAWLELERGDLGRAADLAEQAVGRADELGMRPHLGAIEAFVVAARCRLARGDLAGASSLADSARSDADVFAWRWPRVRAGLVAADARRAQGDATAALAILDDLRAVAGPTRSALDDDLDVATAATHLAAGRHSSPRRSLAHVADRPAARLVLARAALASGDRADMRALLDGHDGWPQPLGLEAEVLLAATEGSIAGERRLVAALRRGADAGWVSPFVLLPAALDDIVGRIPLDELHPDLHRVRGAVDRSPAPHLAVSLAPLTTRERSLLELLPTHLTYAQIGERMYLSVNTVKSNLKSVYRKLAVSSRAEAVEVAREAGLV
ncbi:MAG TPA: LuxR C-terminal-related transcriptional regulator [Acidimicrobiales bacterium]|nr:LuxR C-terminal-related transcriptional regulator [Acidimicrobiales bacterium]